MSDQSPTRLLTVEEVAERLRRSPAAVRWMRYHGTGPRSARMSGRVYFKEADVEAWIEEQFAADQVGTERGAASSA